MHGPNCCGRPLYFVPINLLFVLLRIFAVTGWTSGDNVLKPRAFLLIYFLAAPKKFRYSVASPFRASSKQVHKGKGLTFHNATTPSYKHCNLRCRYLIGAVNQSDSGLSL